MADYIPLGTSEDRIAETVARIHRQRAIDETKALAAMHQTNAIRPHDPGPQLHTYAENTATSEAEWLRMNAKVDPATVHRRHEEIHRMKVEREAPRHSTPYLDMQKLGFLERRRKERETRALERIAEGLNPSRGMSVCTGERPPHPQGKGEGKSTLWQRFKRWCRIVYVRQVS